MDKVVIKFSPVKTSIQTADLPASRAAHASYVSCIQLWPCRYLFENTLYTTNKVNINIKFSSLENLHFFSPTWNTVPPSKFALIFCFVNFGALETNGSPYWLNFWTIMFHCESWSECNVLLFKKINFFTENNAAFLSQAVDIESPKK